MGGIEGLFMGAESIQTIPSGPHPQPRVCVFGLNHSSLCVWFVAQAENTGVVGGFPGVKWNDTEVLA